MNKLILYICGLFLLCACHENVFQEFETTSGTLELSLQKKSPIPQTTKTVDQSLALTLLDEAGQQVAHYPASQVPSKIVLRPGRFTLIAYTENQETWKSANDGKGEPCYYSETPFEIGEDEIVQLHIEVPLSNYAVTFSLPQNFGQFFSEYTFTLQGEDRTLSLRENEKAYFSPNEEGFQYAFRVVNTDGVTHSHPTLSFTDCLAGKLYTIQYLFESSSTEGFVQIEVSDEVEYNDNLIDI